MAVIPQRFSERMRNLLGSESEQLLSALTEPPVMGLRVNTFKLTPAALQQLTACPLVQSPGAPRGLLFPTSYGLASTLFTPPGSTTCKTLRLWR